ncbi:hypothetical protein KF840_13535 [bacterium]|nr:hypothetical protein [bacterium]
MISAALPARAAETHCAMTFDLSGWSAFYKTASGAGTITCDNGQTARVAIAAKGGGLTVGTSTIRDGHGRFSPVASISDLYGDYGMAEAHAGMGRSSSAQVMTRGTVSLELTGKGQGVDVGFAFGKFTIAPRGAAGR